MTTQNQPVGGLATTDHEVIRKWADERGAVPATVSGTEHDERACVLRFDFPGFGADDLEEISWDDWLRVFDEHELAFVYHEHGDDGRTSNFFRLTSRQRADA
ncbi:hypothetical protein [Nonomuraea sp. SBT364]|uniref:hypothetical protein n=1 Tax=Nonomuraea sp. SBT364 TaxID=1580530 RepID=UPI00066B15F1|nr:hypothetical protein [Nonomuraea sp. SBT364]